MPNTQTVQILKTEIVCSQCGASYDRLPAFTCPRCGNPLCKTGCDGCTATCAFKPAVKTKKPKGV